MHRTMNTNATTLLTIRSIIVLVIRKRVELTTAKTQLALNLSQCNVKLSLVLTEGSYYRRYFSHEARSRVKNVYNVKIKLSKCRFPITFYQQLREKLSPLIYFLLMSHLFYQLCCIRQGKVLCRKELHKSSISCLSNRFTKWS